MGGSNRFPTVSNHNIPHFFTGFLRLQLGCEYEALSLSHIGPLSEKQAEAWEGTTFTGICEFRH
jgi:hypothetical protein